MTDILNLFMAGFFGETLPREVKEMLAEGLGGVILFERNISSPEQVRRLTAEIRACAKDAEPLIAIDEEGGRVQRLRKIGLTMPAAREVATGGASAAEAAGAAIGRELASLGVNTDFAPVLDVDSNPVNPIIGDRAYSSDPMKCWEFGERFIAGIEAQGVLACGKHFPGHGDSSLDSHKALPVIGASFETMSSRELVPFSAAIKAGIKLLMTSHCVYPCLDKDLPATLSPAVMRTLLREKLGFGGALVSDDLYMKAISEHHSPGDVIRLGLESGLDMFLFCREPEKAAAGAKSISEMLSRGEVGAGRVEESVSRIRALKEWILSHRDKREALISTDFTLIMKEEKDRIESLSS